MGRKTTIPDNPTLQEVCDGYLAAIMRDGKSGGTTASYSNDLKVATKYLGAETLVHELTPDRVSEFFQADVVTTKRNGTPKNPISIAKTQRILRLALFWAANAGWIKTAPIPAKNAKSGDESTSAELPTTNALATETETTTPEPIFDLPSFDHPEFSEAETPKENARSKRSSKKTKTIAN